MATISLKIEGLDKLEAALKKAPAVIDDAVEAAGDQIGNVILETRGIRLYPPATQANRPPTPYYIRGVGTQTARGNRNNSQMMNKKFTVKTASRVIRIANSATYAPHVIGEFQAKHMKAIGWRSMIDVAKEKQPELTRILNAWLQRAFDKLEL